MAHGKLTKGVCFSPLHHELMALSNLEREKNMGIKKIYNTYENYNSKDFSIVAIGT